MPFILPVRMRIEPLVGTHRLALERDGGAWRGVACLHCEPFTSYARWSVRVAELFGPSELAYLERDLHAQRRCSFVMGRVAARRALACYLDVESLVGFDIGRGVFDQPILADARAEVSISHCEGLAFGLAFPAGHQMAIDCEPIAARSAATIRSHVAAAELEACSSLGLGDAAALTLLWVAREALSKVLRCGLMTSPSTLAVERLHREAGGVIRGRFAHFPQYQVLAWVLGERVLGLVAPHRTEASLAEVTTV
jgi:4'-phosphopantetheinyl transferase